MNDIFTQSATAPTVYFIDDSATMREVIKMAFRKENINVIACHDAASAITQFAHIPPDAVITDVIMPDKDGYEVCQFVKQHPDLQSIPVILMSGVVNRAVAEKAMTVNADELIRKPFQPQDLIARVKNLLNPRKNVAGSPAIADRPKPAAAVLTHVFGNTGAPGSVTPSVAAQRSIPAPAPAAAPSFATPSFAASPFRAPVPVPAQAAPPRPAPPAELLKLRAEVTRLELLVKKLQAELEAERQYCAALESQFQAANQSE